MSPLDFSISMVITRFPVRINLSKIYKQL